VRVCDKCHVKHTAPPLPDPLTDATRYLPSFLIFLIFLPSFLIFLPSSPYLT
jgi:hypothetical protein